MHAAAAYLPNVGGLCLVIFDVHFVLMSGTKAIKPMQIINSLYVNIVFISVLFLKTVVCLRGVNAKFVRLKVFSSIVSCLVFCLIESRVSLHSQFWARNEENSSMRMDGYCFTSLGAKWFISISLLVFVLNQITNSIL